MMYGVPYQGSKNQIAKWVIDNMPPADNFYDLCAGGCAITHCAMLSGRYQNFIINDIDPLPTTLFLDAISGQYSNEDRWISRDDFFSLKDTDAYVALCWSFGNNCRNYLYATNIEPYKKACHYAIVFDDWSLMKELCSEVVDYVKEKLNGYCDLKLRRLRFNQAVVGKLKKLNDWDIVVNNPLYKSCHWRGGKLDSNFYVDLQSLQSLESLERLQSLESLESLERLQRLESLESLERLQRFNTSYDNVEIKPNSIIYCDVPYKGTTGYKNTFDHDKFYKWALNNDNLVFISEYDMPSDFYLVSSKLRMSSFSATNNSLKKEEKLYCNKQITKTTLF